MKKCVRPMLALALALCFGAAAQVQAMDEGYANDAYASQIGYDSFNYSIKQRLASARIGSSTRYFGTAPILVQSDDAYAMAPSSRSSSVAPASASRSRRQLDCVYYSGFTVWADFYQTWARQDTRGNEDGYTYRATAPAVGFDWSNGNFTVGLATTYNWAKIKGKSSGHDREVDHWGTALYAQYNGEKFFANASIGYSYNRFDSARSQTTPFGTVGRNAKYHSNAFNIDATFGYKFNFGGFKVVPNVGLRYFYDRRGNIDEGNSWAIQGGRQNSYTFELPVGVDLSYEIAAGNAIIVPRIRAAWIPELARKRGHFDGALYDGAGVPVSSININGAERSRNGFLVGAGLEAKITKSFSAHIDYNCNFRSGAYEHHWNLGAGFTF